LKDLLQEISDLTDLSPDNVPESYRFLLEMNFMDLASTHLETEWYCTLAVITALTAQQQKNRRGARIKQIHCKLSRKNPNRQKLRITVVEHQIRTEGMQCQPDLNT
jgi:hypothetical protein